ncbi:MAG: SMC-Scp complex subunit ScpB [Planctomycetales bacterium]
MNFLTPRSLQSFAGRLSSESAVGSSWSWRTYRSGETVSEEDSPEILSHGRRTPKMARLEAVLFVAGGALSTRRLAQFATLADPTEARTLIKKLNDLYDRMESPFRIEQVAAGYQLLTRSEFSHWLDKLHERQAELKLTAGQMETLSIVAYRQPVIRADIEAIRGVACIEMLKQLMERGLVKIGGADETLGRPHLYETTRRFLEIFGLRTIEDLPMYDRLHQGPSQPRPEAAPQSPEAAA